MSYYNELGPWIYYTGPIVDATYKEKRITVSAESREYYHAYYGELERLSPPSDFFLNQRSPSIREYAGLIRKDDDRLVFDDLSALAEARNAAVRGKGAENCVSWWQ